MAGLSLLFQKDFLVNLEVYQNFVIHITAYDITVSFLISSQNIDKCNLRVFLKIGGVSEK